VPHERLPGMLEIEKLVEEGDHLGLVLRTIEVWGDPGEIDAFAQIVVAAVLEPLKKDCDAIRRGWLPILVEHSPGVVRDRVLLCEGQVDHGEDRPLAGEYAAEEERDHRFLDIFAVEVARNGGAEFGQAAVRSTDERSTETRWLLSPRPTMHLRRSRLRRGSALAAPRKIARARRSARRPQRRTDVHIHGPRLLGHSVYSLKTA
jgi:hypothetical protein